jgi:hypothetical protein
MAIKESLVTDDVNGACPKDFTLAIHLEEQNTWSRNKKSGAEAQAIFQNKVETRCWLKVELYILHTSTKITS